MYKKICVFHFFFFFRNSIILNKINNEKFKKNYFGCFGTLILVPSFYGCSNENDVSQINNNQTSKIVSRSINKEAVVELLANDAEFVDYLNETYHLLDNVDSTVLLKYSSIDRDLTTEEGLEFSRGFGFDSIQDFDVYYIQNFNRLNNIYMRYNLNSFEKTDLDFIFIGAIDRVNQTTNSDHCNLQRKACRSGATNSYTQDILGCAAAGGLIAGLSAGSLAWLGAGVAQGCVAYAAYNFHTQIQLCEANFKKCK